jgi:acetylornithine deacetylase/succinyl-diaminopimelate desuccinylase-like protein
VAVRQELADRFASDALPSLIDYVAIRCLSPAFDPSWEVTGAIDAAVEHLATWAAARSIKGIDVTVHRLAGRTPVLLIEIPATPGATGATLLYGHLDKQPPLGSWSEGLDPYRGLCVDGLLYGRGTADDGYSLYTSLLAIESLERQGRSHGRCVILIEASEESGSPDLDAHLDALRDRLGDLDLVICLDSGALDYERLWVTTSLRGNLVVSVSVTVLEHGVHSGEAGGIVPSSFRILRELLDRIEDPTTGEIRLEALRAQPPTHVLAAAAALAADLDDPLSRHFPTVDGLALMGRDGADRLIRQSWSASLSVIGIDGVPSVADGGNVLRASTTAKLSLRIPPSVDAIVAQAALIEALRTAPPEGAQIEVVAEQPAQGWVAPEPQPWLLDALDEGSRQGFGLPAGFLGEGGSIPFLASLGQRFPGVQFVATGVLGPGSNAHGPDESLHLGAVAGIATALTTLLEAQASHTSR